MIPILACLFLLQFVSAQNLATKYANTGQFPYIVSIRLARYNTHLCVGNVISARWVLSAAICYTSEDGTEAIIGGPDLIIYADTIDDEDKSGKSFIGKNLILHSGFTRPSLRNNIALVELSSSLYWFWQLYFYLTSIKPISLGEVPPLSTVVSAGWNTVNDSLLLSTKLNYYYLTTGETSPNGCKSSPEFICTLNQPEDVLCHFDAGAPLILTTNSKERLVGIGSHLINECENQSGATFTRVASYVSWINVITGETFAV